MALLVTNQGTSTITSSKVQTVSTIAYLDAPAGWDPVPHLYSNRFSFALNAYGEASLVYEIGADVKQIDGTTITDYQPLALKGKFVRIVVTTTPTPITWYGYILNDEQQRDAVKDVGGVNKLVGRQQVVDCVGLAYFLDRKSIDSSVVRNTGAAPNYLRIYRPLTFNGGPDADLKPGSTGRGNRSQAVGGAGVYDFTDSPEGAPLWSAEQIIQHVLKYHTMVNSGGAPAPAPFELWPGDFTSFSAGYFLSGFYPTVPTQGVTVFQLLNKICASQRGLVWWCEYVPADGKIYIHVQSTADADVVLPGGGTLPANSNQQELDFDSEVDVTKTKVTQVGHRDFDQLVVRGARMTSTCTVGCADNTLIPDWSLLTSSIDVGTEKKYFEAAKFDSDYGGLSTDQKKTRNDAYRRSEVFHRVFSSFRVPNTWDGKTGDGGSGQRGYTFPQLSPTGSVLGTLGWHQQGLRMLNTLRLKRGWDYANPLAPKSNSPSGTLGELSPPFAFVQVASSPTRFQVTDKLKDSNFAVGSSTSSSIKTSYHLYMQKTVPGIRLAASGGMPHALALNVWAGAEPSGSDAEISYNTLRATVCLEADAYCEAKYPEAGFAANKPLEILQLELGDHYRLDFLAANTVVHISNGQLVTASSAAVLRDDRKYLQDIAKMAYQWYRTDRNSLGVTFRQVRNLFGLGMYITSIGTGTTAQNINTVVSNIVVDMKAGTMQIETADDTLDVRSLNV